MEGRGGGKNKGSRAATEDPLQGRGIESACAERQKVVCLVSSWLENHVVPAIIISKARASGVIIGCSPWAIVVMSCYFSLLPNFHGCDFWVVRISFSGYSCTRKAYFDPSWHRCRIISSLTMAMMPVGHVGCFRGWTWEVAVGSGLRLFYICLFFRLCPLPNSPLRYCRRTRYCVLLFIGN